MDKKYRAIAFNPLDSWHRQAAAGIWNRACGADIAITPEFVRFNTLPVRGVEQQGQLIFCGDQPAGFALASYELGSPSPLLSSLMHQGWIDALAVSPDHARKGIGGDLINWAQTWLVSRGSKLIHLGGSMRPFTPGLPVKLGAQGFFLKLGFADKGMAWDLSNDLVEYQPRLDSRLEQVRPLQPEQTGAMRDFLRKEFPDRWLFEFEEAVRTGDRLTDYQALWVDGEINGLVNLTFEDSPRPLERFYMTGLPRPWGQLGTVGLSCRLRGQGYGALLMDSGLRRLQAVGVRGCVIDWTGLLDFYSKFGFKPFRQYQILEKDFYL